MPKFFVDEPIGETVTLTGQTALHIAKSLRMKAGEEVVLCDGKGFDYACIIESITKEEVHLKLGNCIRGFRRVINSAMWCASAPNSV